VAAWPGPGTIDPATPHEIPSALNRDAAITKAPAPDMKPLRSPPLNAAMRLLRQFLYIEAAHNPN
jgi:hypothetical protein